MRHKMLFKLVAVLFGFALVGAACSSDDSADEKSTTESSVEKQADDAEKQADDQEAKGANEDIVQIASSDKDFSTLVGLLTAAGLDGTLTGPGPYTVMAPTNEAFAKVPAATLASLQADPMGALTDVLRLHVISGKVDSKAAASAAGTCVDTLGGKVKIAKDGDNLTFGGATIEKVDIEGSNGIIHVIDGVVTAPSTDC